MQNKLGSFIAKIYKRSFRQRLNFEFIVNINSPSISTANIIMSFDFAAIRQWKKRIVGATMTYSSS